MNLLRQSSIRRIPRFASAVALALDELGNVARHLAEEQAHRDVGEGESERQCEGERENDGGECEKGGHLPALIASALPKPVLCCHGFCR